jgi:hypothetical protein
VVIENASPKAPRPRIQTRPRREVKARP